MVANFRSGNIRNFFFFKHINDIVSSVKNNTCHEKNEEDPKEKVKDKIASIHLLGF